MSKEIHVTWPVLCKTELGDVVDKLNAILERINYRGDKDMLVMAMRSTIFAGEKAFKALEEAYGK